MSSNSKSIRAPKLGLLILVGFTEKKPISKDKCINHLDLTKEGCLPKKEHHCMLFS
jgi:hypothetical protein